MKKFDIEFETMMRLEQALFVRRRLELEIQMKELETKYQLMEEGSDLERKVKRTALENDAVRSQSTSARDKSPFASKQPCCEKAESLHTISQFTRPFLNC